jgi:hypothetical protein
VEVEVVDPYTKFSAAMEGAAENNIIFGGCVRSRRKLRYFLRPTPGRRKSAVIFGGHPLAAENNSGRRKSCTVLL